MNKKWLFSGFFIVVLAYFFQIFYMGKINKEIFNDFTKENSIYKIENLQFNEGFFKSDANFDLVFKDVNLNSYIKEKTHIRIIFSNNLFAKNNLEIDLNNPFVGFDNIFNNGLLAKIYINVSLNKDISADFKFSDINSSDIIIKGSNAKIALNDKLLIRNIYSNIEKLILLNDFRKTKAVFSNISYKNEYKTPFSLNDFFTEFSNNVQIRESISSANIENISFYRRDINDVNVSNIISTNIINFNDDNATFKNEFKLNISNLMMANDKLDNIKIDLIFNNISKDLFSSIYLNKEQMYEKFAIYRPNLVLNDFSFYKNNKNITAKADALMENSGFKINLNVISDELITKFFPITAIFNADKYFIEKDGKYTMDLMFDSTDINATKMSINGKDETLSNVNLD